MKKQIVQTTYEVVHVIWRDSNMYHEQIENDYDFCVSTFETVGFMLKNNKKDVVIARDCLGKESRSIIVIPKENIVSMKICRK